MKRSIGLVAISAALFAAACQDQPSAPVETAPVMAAAPGLSQVQGSYIVVFRPGVSDPDGVTDQLIRTFGGSVQYRYQAAIQGFAATLPPQAVEAISRNPNVEYVEADAVMTTTTVQTNATWGLDRIDQRALPLSGTYGYGVDGSGVHMYIIDTGIRATHTEFTGRMKAGYTAISDGRGTNDCNGHGTHVAGTAGGTVYGVAKKVSLIPVRVLNCRGSGTTSGVIAGVDWVTANHLKPAVANMSLGGGASSALDAAVANSIAAGVTYAVAAGNSNANACNYSPARVPAAVTVGATTNTDARASYSNFGSCLDLFAPGSSITSAWYESNTDTNTISGTSMAAPHVAGVAALILQAGHQSPADVRDLIVGGGTTGVVTSAGAGSANVLLFNLYDGGGSPPPPPANVAPTASFTYDCANLACTFDGSGSSDSDGNVTGYAWTFGDGTGGSGQTAQKTYGTSGSFTVMLTVTDNGGATGVTEQTVTVTAPEGPGPGTGLAVHVGTIQGSGVSVNRNFWRANVTVTVIDAGGQPVGGVSVTGSWSGGTSGSTSCTTDGSGVCTVQSSNIGRGTASVLWSLGSLSGSGLVHDTTKDSATSVQVSRP